MDDFNAHIKYRQLKAFSLVIELGSFKAAADYMSITQPSLSALVKELENDLGLELVDRTGRRLAATQAGQAFFEEIRAALEHIETAYRYAREVSAGNVGKLSLAVLPSTVSGVVVSVLSEFRRRHPLIKIHLTECSPLRLWDSVRHGQVEIGLGTPPVELPEIDFVSIYTDELLVYVPKGHHLLSGEVTWASLESQDLIVLAGGEFTRTALSSNRVNVTPIIEVDQGTTALAMVKAGLGIAVLSSSIIPKGDDSVHALRIRGQPALRPIGVLRRRNSMPTTIALAFIELLRDEVGRH